MAEETTIKCAQCAHDNDSTRVFCGNCGARLDRTAEDPKGAKAAKVAKKKEKKQKPVKARITKAKGGGKPNEQLAGFIRMAWTSALIGVVIATWIQMLRMPDFIPAEKPPNAENAKEAWFTFKGAAMNPRGGKLVINQSNVNNYLASNVEVVSNNSLLVYKRTFVIFTSGSFGLGLHMEAFGRPIYFVENAEPEGDGDGVSARITGGHIGRMPIHPAIMAYVHKIFAPTLTALAEPIDMLRQLTSVKITPVDATMQWPRKKK